MIPILYDSITEGVVPTHYGVGPLTDALSCTVHEVLNGLDELTLTYPAQGIHAEDITPGCFIKAKPNFTDDPQIFRIYKVGKTMAGKFTVNARHISYDLGGKIITTGSAGSCAAACALLNASAGNFIISTNKTLSGAFSVSQPASVRSWFGGKEGSILDVYGPGEWKYDNYTASFLTARGVDRSVTIRYGKNLTQLSQELDMTNLVTGIYPFYIDPNGLKTIGDRVPTDLILDVDRDVAIDFSGDVDPESQTSIEDQLEALANRYIQNNNLTTIANSITLDFVQMKDITERVDLGDTVSIYFEALGISAKAKCVETVWDVLQERYTKTTFGKTRANIADTIAAQSKLTAQAITRQEMNEATQLITGNLGGYVVLEDSDGDGKPDEILIMDTADKDTATKVWRWNKSGLGYSPTGHEGPYDLAMTSTGEIDASFLKVGVIQDQQGNSTIDMTNGEAILNNMKAKRTLRLIDAAGTARGQLSYTVAGGTLLSLYDQNQTYDVAITAHSTDGGRIYLKHPSNEAATVDICSNYSNYQNGKVAVLGLTGNILAGMSGSIEDRGSIGVYNAGSEYVDISAMATGGYILLTDNADNINIRLNGGTGEVKCVTVTQTSSRKTKENIKPMEDSEKILELEAVSFDFKDKEQGTDRRGFIAEDVEKVLPNLVKQETETEPAALDYVGMIPYLQDIIKKQEARITALEEKIKSLEG